MHLFLLTAGSRGDVVPFLALADRALADGHAVTLGVTREFVGLAREHVRSVVSLDGDFEELVRAQGADPWTALRSYRTVVKPMLEAVQRSAAEAILETRPDVVVHHPKILVAEGAAAAVGALSAVVEIVPVLTPTREYPAAGIVSQDLGPFNRWTFTAARWGTASFQGIARAALRDLGIDGDAKVQPDLTLCPMSPALLPRPTDWPETSHLTGPWRPQHVGDPVDEQVEAFLAGGDVVYAGFGSMATGDPEQRAREVVGGIRTAGLRALIAQGWGGMSVPEDLVGDDLLVVDQVDHAHVLSRVVAAVHHGGAGTVHAATGAGAVSVIVPFAADQPWWGAYLSRRRLAPPPVPSRRLTAQRIAEALAEVDRFRSNVAHVADQMRSDDGTGTALQVLQG